MTNFLSQNCPFKVRFLMGISETNGAEPSQTQKKMPRMSRALFEFGGPGRNRTTDTRIFKYPPIDRFRFDFKGLSHQSQLV